MAKSVAQIVHSVKRGTGTGKIFTTAQVKPFLDKQLQEAADAFKEFVVELIEVNRQHKIRRDDSGLYANIVSSFTTDGAKLSVPQYAEDLDNGRAPGIALVPLDAIVRWIKRYRIVGRQKKTGKFQKANTDVNAAAYAIQQAIFRNGIKARPWLETALGFQDTLVASLVDEIIFPQIVSVLEFTAKK
ncbi:hypothetical protein I2I05_08590 [Hymenobacter sp. BT683]|uniref:Uncharacterized protein n=1 Tax=Hymenobacter jeongseonensis TaxID=2791027 RepID=A0ABS0IHC6_9BACT|nr:hypothetical protein [Hymenobacter jeongseonensis]MBF9237454.1 hypothetical protein [Hymenobacter jeongseonensis]